MASTLLLRWALVALILLAPSLTAAEVGTATERYDRLERALNGDREAMAAVEQDADDSCFNRWILGSALHRQGKIDEAIEHFLAAARLGDVRATLALADINHKARRLVDSYAWAQIWVLNHFDMRQIQSGEGNQDAGMVLLRANLNSMNDSEVEQAETLAIDFQAQLGTADSQDCGRRSESEWEWEPEHRRQPRYPSGMAHQGRSGWTQSMLLVDPIGDVQRVTIIYSSHRAFERPTRRAMERWQFQPADGVEPDDGAILTQIMEYVIE